MSGVVPCQVNGTAARGNEWWVLAHTVVNHRADARYGKVETHGKGHLLATKPVLDKAEREVGWFKERLVGWLVDPSSLTASGLQIDGIDVVA